LHRIRHVLYSHFEGKTHRERGGLEGFGELPPLLHNARERAGSPDAAATSMLLDMPYEAVARELR